MPVPTSPVSISPVPISPVPTSPALHGDTDSLETEDDKDAVVHGKLMMLEATRGISAELDGELQLQNLDRAIAARLTFREVGRIEFGRYKASLKTERFSSSFLLELR